ncbi:MAG: tetratricopeptide repeat protein [Deltaproteobacteria bacterium]|nr:tetratricopeptide repeat protein [Deltaproteobacteria bacterium]
MPFDLAKEALIASGLGDQRQIAHYLAKLEQLHSLFLDFTRGIGSSSPVEKAEKLFRFLWREKPFRYKKNGPFKFHTVIRNQLSKDTLVVGNCLGLTLLYNSLLLKHNIAAKALYLEDAFGEGPHVLTVIETGGLILDVENVLPWGFGYKGHIANHYRVIWDNRELVADLYLSMGNEFFNESHLDEAEAAYEMALRLNPRHEKARLNRVILMDKRTSETRG